MDTRFGIHTPSDYNWVPSNLIEWCEDAKRHGVNLVTGWWNCQVQVEFAKALTDHGIRIIYRPGQNLIPSQFIGGDLEKYREAGAEFCQFYNEPNLFGEWKDEKKASPEYFAELWAARCQSLKSIGFTPVVPPLSPGGNLYHRDFFHRMMNWWKNQGMLPDLLRGCVLGIHNRPITNPPDDDGDCSFNEYKRYRQWMQEIMGFTLPMVAPEAGYEPQWVGYDWERWKDWNMELIRRFQPAHPKYVGADFLGSCFWICDDLNSTWDHCSLVNNWRYGQDHGGDRTTNLWRALEAEDWGTAPPVPPPTPPPTPTPPLEVKMKGYLKDGTQVDPTTLLKSYSVTIEPCTGAGFRVVEVRERCEAANCDVWVKGAGAEPLVGKSVRWGWPGEEVDQETDPYGRVGFAMAASAKYDPAVGGGPHWTAVAGNSETIRGIGMIMGTVHCTLNFVFQYLEGTPAPQPEPEPPTPEPGPDDDPYLFKKRLERDAPYGFKDMREQVIAVTGVDMEAVKVESYMAGRLSKSGAPLFNKMEAIVLHHLGREYLGALELVEWAVNDCEDVNHKTNPYHFLIEKSGRILFMVALKYLTHHAYAANYTGIGVCFEDGATEAQMESGRFLIAALEELMGGDWGTHRRLGLMPHFMVWNGEKWYTSCPGKVWPKILRGPWPDFRGSL